MTTDGRYNLTKTIGRSKANKCNKYRYLHRALIEEHLGRELSTEEHVHHKNGNRLDNRINNLEIMTNSQHLKEHYKKRDVCKVTGLFESEKTQKIRKKVLERRKRVLELREKGLSFQEIGRVVGIARQTAHSVYSKHKDR